MNSDDLAALRAFLRRAKLATYAAQGDNASVVPLLLDTKQLEYREGDWLYRDIYTGMSRFVGQEIVYRGEHGLWSMSYSGGLVDAANADARAVYVFLREALRAVPEAMPLRGPVEMTRDTLRYRCDVVGTIDRFNGTELIADSETALYELHFSGGITA